MDAHFARRYRCRAAVDAELYMRRQHRLSRYTLIDITKSNAPDCRCANAIIRQYFIAVHQPQNTIQYDKHRYDTGKSNANDTWPALGLRLVLGELPVVNNPHISSNYTAYDSIYAGCTNVL